MKCFDELLNENGLTVPRPTARPVYACLDAEIRKVKEEINDIEWEGPEAEKTKMFGKRGYLYFLLSEKRRGMTKIMKSIELLPRLEDKKGN